MLSNRMHIPILGLLLIWASSCACSATGADVVQEIKQLQRQLIQDFNRREYDKVVAAYDASYVGLITEKGVLTLDARKAMYKSMFASADPGTMKILQTDVRPLDDDFVLIRSHLRNVYGKGKAPDDWWYSSVYMRYGHQWKIIHEQ